jgi:FMN phosphatase YigB (HAD superfamily)
MIKAVVSDIGGVFELEPLGRDPTARFPELIADWERRLHLPPGAFDARRKAMNRYFDASGKDGELGTLSQAQWQAGLRPRYRTALLSNSFDGAREREQDRYHFAEMVDLIIYSHEVGLAKPDPRIYALTSQRLGVQPQEVVFLDDAERNVAAAAAYGFHAILYQHNAQAIAEIERCLQAL